MFNNNTLRWGRGKGRNPFVSATDSISPNENSRLAVRCAANCATEGATKSGLRLRANRLGYLPDRILTCSKTGRHVALYPGMSEANVARNHGFTDYTVEPVEARV